MSNSKVFRCEACDYSTPVKCNFDKHIRSTKHQNIVKNLENKKNQVDNKTNSIDNLKSKISEINTFIQDKQRLVIYESKLEVLGS